MIVAIPVTGEGQAGHSWGKAARVAVADLVDGELHGWAEHEVRWDLSHDADGHGRHGGHGEHHARIVRFLREHGVTDVIVGHLGPGMVRTLESMRITVTAPVGSDARAAVRHLAAG